MKPKPTITCDTMKKAIMVDLDNTIAIHNGRTPFEYHKLHTDLVNIPIAHIVKKYLDDPEYTVIYCSGREGSEQVWKDTYEWLVRNGLWVDAFKTRLYMRQWKDFRKDTIVKEEIYNKMIKPYFDVLFVLDDRLQVCRMWHSIGLTLLRVGDPDADF